MLKESIESMIYATRGRSGNLYLYTTEPEHVENTRPIVPCYFHKHILYCAKHNRPVSECKCLDVVMQRVVSSRPACS